MSALTAYMTKYSYKDLASACAALFEENGFVTSLDVKKALRARAFYATQADVSADLQHLADVAGWIVEDNGTFRTYVQMKMAFGDTSKYGLCGSPECDCGSEPDDCQDQDINLFDMPSANINVNYDPFKLQNLVRDVIGESTPSDPGENSVWTGMKEELAWPNGSQVKAERLWPIKSALVEGFEKAERRAAFDEVYNFVGDMAKQTALMTVTLHEVLERLADLEVTE